MVSRGHATTLPCSAGQPVLLHSSEIGGGKESAANPPEAHQRRTAERLKAVWHELDTGHYPMLSQPEELTRLLLGPVS